jgi:hypothetical protein
MRWKVAVTSRDEGRSASTCRRLRLAKSFRVRDRVRVQANLDLYNALNSGDVLVTTNAYGARWLLPTLIPEPRILQFGAQVTF